MCSPRHGHGAQVMKMRTLNCKLMHRILLYYITDRKAFAADEPERRSRVLEKIGEATQAGVDFIQLREKDLSLRELESLAREAVGVVRKVRAQNPSSRTALLVNSRTDVALVTGCDGVHLRGEDVSPSEVRRVWESYAEVRTPGSLENPQIGISCHSPLEVRQAASEGATFAVFAPVFKKEGAQPAGVSALREACQAKIPVLALGGVTLENAELCLQAGAAGIAGIRLFQEHDVAKIVKQLRD